MALILKDRVRETSTTTGLGTFTLAGAVSGYQSFSAIGNGNTTYYCIYLQGGNEWEVGIGTYTSSGTTLSRDTVLASSDSGNKVTFSAGTKDVFVTYPAGRSVNYNQAGTGVDVTGTVSATAFSGPLNGTVGATTPNTGAFTTLSASGAATFSGGNIGVTAAGGSVSSAVFPLRISWADASGTNFAGLQIYNTGAADYRAFYGADNNGTARLGDNGGGGIKFYSGGIAGTNIGTWTTTGLAVTGTLTASSGATITKTGAAQQDVLTAANAQAAAADVGPAFRLEGVGTVGIADVFGAWTGAATTDSYLRVRVRSSNALTEVGRFTGTGLAVTGTLSSTGSITTTGGQVNVRGTGSSQNYEYQIDNDDTFVQQYASRNSGVSKGYKWYTSNTGASLRMTLDSTGLAVTGTLSSTGSLTTGTGSASVGYTMNGAATSGNGPYIDLRANSVNKAYIGLYSGLHNSTATDLELTSTSDNIYLTPGSATKALRVSAGSDTTDLGSTGLVIGGRTTLTSGNVLMLNFTPIGADSNRARAGIGCEVGADWGKGNLTFYTKDTSGAGAMTTSDERMRIDSSGVVRTGSATTSGASSGDICLPNNIALRGANTTNAASRKLAYVDTGNFAAYGDASLNGVKITGNTSVTGIGGGAYVGEFVNSNSSSYGIYVAAGGGGGRQIAYFTDYAGAVTMNVQAGQVTVTGRQDIVGAGSSSATYGLVVQTSGASANNFYVRDDGLCYVRGDLLVGTTDSSDTSGVGLKMIYNATAPLFASVGSSTSNGSTTNEVYSTGAGAYRFYVGYGGTVYATNTTISAISDIRFKENVRDIDSGLDAILALRPRVFDWKEGKGKDVKNDRGFIAQEFEQVFPDLIDEWKDPAPEGEEPYKSVRQDLIPVLVKAIQELNAKVAALEAKNAPL